MQSDANTRGTRILTRSPHQQHDCGCRLHSDGHSMDGEDDTTLVREQQALSFNPFGDELELEANAADRDEADEVTHRLAHLSIPSPVHGVGGYTSSNASSAVSTHTNPLFDGAAVVDASLAGGQAASPKQSASTTTAAAAGFFLNPTADSYAPPAVSSSTSSPLYKRTPSSGSGVVSLIAGAGQAPSSVRRHRLSSASSVKSTRSRRSTNSSISSIASKLLPQSHSDADASSFDVAAGSPAGVVADSNASQQPPGITRPITRTSNSQESMISLQPSVMSLETTARSPPPVAGYRIPATGSLRHSSFPQLSMCGPAFKDFDSHPIYVCSAILGTAIHPAKAGPHLSPPVRMSFAGKEILHEGRYDLLPITPE